MNDEQSAPAAATPIEPAEGALPEKKKRRPKMACMLALQEILDRKKFGGVPNYKLVAARWNVAASSLKQLVYDYGKGRVDMSAAVTFNTPQEKRIDQEGELRKQMELSNRYEKLLTATLAGALIKAEEMAASGDAQAYRKSGVPDIVKDIANLKRLQQQLEKGYLILQDRVKPVSAIDVTSPPPSAPKLPDAAHAVDPGLVASALKG